jgi:hypothetical protein
MKINLKIEDRYLEILSICKLSKREFCDLLNIVPQNYCRFIQSKKIDIYDLDVIESLGINARWLTTGFGSRYNFNEKGNQIKSIFDKLEQLESNYHLNKLTYWVETHYSKLCEFENTYNISNQNYFNFSERNNQIAYELVKILANDGLNFKWLYHFDEHPYLTSENGRMKKKWILENCNNENIIYKELTEKIYNL